MTVERSTWNRTLGLVGGTSSILFTALILCSVAIATGASDLIYVAFVMTTLGLLLGAGLVAGTRIAARRDERRFHEAVRRIRDMATHHPSTPKEPTRPHAAQQLESPILTIDEEPLPSSPEEAPRRVDRARD